MNDQELIEFVETKVFYQMMQGCEVDDHLKHRTYDTGSWSASFRTDTLCRLIDMAKNGIKE